MPITEIENENDLKVKSYQFGGDEGLENIPSPLMNKAFFYILVGKKGSGKTSLMLSMVCSKQMYKKKFDKIFVFSNSLKSLGDKNPFLKLPEGQRFTKLTFENLEQVDEDIRGSGDKCLIIFDDVQGSLKSNRGLTELFTDFIQNARHISGGTGLVSIIITTQIWNSGIPLDCRKQADMIFMFQSKNKKEIESLKDEFLGSYSWDEVNNIFKFVYKDPHDFLIIKTAGTTESLYRNFNKLVFS